MRQNATHVSSSRSAERRYLHMKCEVGPGGPTSSLSVSMKSTKRKRGAAAADAAVPATKVVGAPKPSALEANAGPVTAAPSSTIVLASHCSVKDATTLKASLSAAFGMSDEVTLDVAAIERIDTATVQLLCAFVRDRAASGQAVAWRGESTTFSDAVRLLGVGSMLSFSSAQKAYP